MADTWRSITVEPVGRPGAELWPCPGRAGTEFRYLVGSSIWVNA